MLSALLGLQVLFSRKILLCLYLFPSFVVFTLSATTSSYRCSFVSTSPHCVHAYTNSLISWKTKKYDLVSQSSAEVEYCVMATTTGRAPGYITSLLIWALSISASTSLHCDNTSAIQIATKLVFHECTKHIEIDFHNFVCDIIHLG